jgi:hypothetical protein
MSFLSVTIEAVFWSKEQRQAFVCPLPSRRYSVVFGHVSVAETKDS